MKAIDNGIIEIFEERDRYLKRLNQSTYEENYRHFRDRYGHMLNEALEALKDDEDISKAMDETAVSLSELVWERYSKNGRMKNAVSMDINFVMIYYIFPYLLEQTQCGGPEFAERLRLKWNEIHKCNISYAPYDEIYRGFKKRLFGYF